MLLGFKDRAELANADYISIASVMEGVVIVEKKIDPTIITAIVTSIPTVITNDDNNTTITATTTIE